MPRIISEECLSCGSCEGQCPVNAISMGKDHFEVNEAECIDCGACEAACPVSAIKQKYFYIITKKINIRCQVL